MKNLSDTQKAQEKIFEECGVFFAFNKAQFDEGVKKVGASADNKITQISSGIFVLSNYLDIFQKKMTTLRAEGLKQDIEENGKENIIHRELANYETQITGNLREVVEALEDYGISEDEIRSYFRQKYIPYCIENDLF